jgi:hypothetical protein
MTGALLPDALLLVLLGSILGIALCRMAFLALGLATLGVRGWAILPLAFLLLMPSFGREQQASPLPLWVSASLLLCDIIAAGLGIIAIAWLTSGFSA